MWLAINRRRVVINKLSYHKDCDVMLAFRFHRIIGHMTKCNIVDIYAHLLLHFPLSTFMPCLEHFKVPSGKGQRSRAMASLPFACEDFACGFRVLDQHAHPYSDVLLLLRLL